MEAPKTRLIQVVDLVAVDGKLEHRLKQGLPEHRGKVIQADLEPGTVAAAVEVPEALVAMERVQHPMDQEELVQYQQLLQQRKRLLIQLGKL
jgi:hypothetical protein